MANVNILNLPVVTSLDGSEYVPLVQGLGDLATTRRAQTGLISGGPAASTQSANTVFAGPASGIPAVATFRALVAADIPNGLPAGGTTGQRLAKSSSSDYATEWVTDGGGTVTSVAMTAPSFLSVAGSPVTTSGTLDVSLADQTAHTVFVGPAAGDPDVPTFRELVAGDIPEIGFESMPRGLAGYAIIGNGVDSNPSYQGFLQTGTGAVTRTWQDKGEDVVSVKDFGAVGDNVTDDSAAFQLAFNAAANVLVPAGSYYLGNTNISASDKAFSLQGDGMGVSVLRWNGSSGGITLNQDNGLNPMAIGNLSLFQSGAAVGTAIFYDGTGQISVGSIANRTYPRLSLTNVNIRGSTGVSTDGWQRCIVGESVLHVVVDGIHMEGMFSGSQSNIQTTKGIYLYGSGGPVEAVVTNTWANYVGNAVEASTFEGLFVSNCNFVAVNKGVLFDDAAGGPQIAVSNNHMAVYEFAIEAIGLSQASIVGNLFYSRNDAPGDVTLIKLGTASSLNSIAGNVFVKTSATTNVAIDIGDGSGTCLRNSIHDNLYQSMDTAINLRANASTTQISGGNYRNVTTMLADAGVSTRRWGEDDLTSVFGGTPLTLINTADTAINIGLDIQSDRATPAANDRIGMSYRMSDSAGNQDEFGRIEAFGSSVTSGAESSHLRFYTVGSGTLAVRAALTSADWRPVSDDLIGLGQPSIGWADGYFASGAILGFGNGNYSITHSSGDLSFSGTVTLPNTGLHLLDTNASHDLIISPGSNLTADRTLTLTTGDANRTLDISAASVTVSSFGASLVDDAAAINACATLNTWYVLGASGAAVSHTGDTNETTLATITVPAASMGANGVVRVTTVWSHTNSGNNKTPRVRFGGVSGSIYFNPTITTTASTRAMTQIANRNSASSQTGFAPSTGTGGFGSTAVANATSAVDTASAVDLVISGQLADTGETITLESYTVELLFRT